MIQYKAEKPISIKFPNTAFIWWFKYAPSKVFKQEYPSCTWDWILMDYVMHLKCKKCTASASSWEVKSMVTLYNGSNEYLTYLRTIAYIRAKISPQN